MKVILSFLVFFFLSTDTYSENIATFDPETNEVHIPSLQILGDTSNKLYAVELLKSDDTYMLSSVIELKNIWNEESKSIEIVQFNGYTMNPDDRYTTYSYSIPDLSNEALELLSTIKTTRDNLLCHFDRTYYQVSITDKLGQEKHYYTNYNSCNENQFIDRTIVENLLALLNP